MKHTLNVYRVFRKNQVVRADDIMEELEDICPPKTAGEAWEKYLGTYGRDHKYWHALGYRAKRFQITIEEVSSNGRVRKSNTEKDRCSRRENCET